MLDSNERIKLMFDLSKEYEKEFLNQKDIVEEVQNIHLNTDGFSKITPKEVKIIGKDLCDLVYAAILYENSLSHVFKAWALPSPILSIEYVIVIKGAIITKNPIVSIRLTYAKINETVW